MTNVSTKRVLTNAEALARHIGLFSNNSWEIYKYEVSQYENSRSLKI